MTAQLPDKMTTEKSIYRDLSFATSLNDRIAPISSESSDNSYLADLVALLRFGSMMTRGYPEARSKR
jgi:hypothetical protein